MITMNYFYIPILVALTSYSTLNVVVSAELNLATVNSSPVNCDKWRDIVDECGLMMGYSFLFRKYAYPVSQAALTESCKRTDAAIKCFKSYAKCMSPLSKQVANQVVQSRIKFQKKICTPQPTEFTTRFVDMSQCMHKYNLTDTKGARAETGATLASEAINSAFPEANDMLLKHSCCTVAKFRREFKDTVQPQCAKHAALFAELIDAYVGEAIGIVCPEMDPVKLGCDKLPKLRQAKRPKNRFFIKPVIEVVQKLN